MTTTTEKMVMIPLNNQLFSVGEAPLKRSKISSPQNVYNSYLNLAHFPQNKNVFLLICANKFSKFHHFFLIKGKYAAQFSLLNCTLTYNAIQ